MSSALLCSVIMKKYLQPFNTTCRIACHHQHFHSRAKLFQLEHAFYGTASSPFVCGLQCRQRRRRPLINPWMTIQRQCWLQCYIGTTEFHFHCKVVHPLQLFYCSVRRVSVRHKIAVEQQLRYGMVCWTRFLPPTVNGGQTVLVVPCKSYPISKSGQIKLTSSLPSTSWWSVAGVVGWYFNTLFITAFVRAKSRAPRSWRVEKVGVLLLSILEML